MANTRRFAQILNPDTWRQGKSVYDNFTVLYMNIFIVILLAIAFIISYIDPVKHIRASVILTIIASVLGGLLLVYNGSMLTLLLILSIGLIVQDFNDTTMDTLRMITTALTALTIFALSFMTSSPR